MQRAMPRRPPNLLILMSDEHARRVAGCYGDPIIQTPNLDRLAARGTLFTDAYTPSPICVPARAAMATGRYVHETRHWDNAMPYAGTPESWGHPLQRAGYRVETIGKLHFRRVEDPYGFDHQEIPMHVVDGVGDVLGAVREPLPERKKARNMAEKIGPGETSYTRYDRDVRDAAVRWLENKAARDDRPWTLMVSFVAPHFPLIAPEKFYDLYRHSGLMPSKPAGDPASEHPWLAAFRRCFVFDNFTEERTAVALASYFGLVSFLDDNVGQVLGALERSGLAATTRVLYTSDHGDNMGERDLWGKSTFYEESAGIPLILAGPGVPEGHRCRTPASLYDVYPTVLHSAGLEDGEPTREKPGRSLLSLATADDDPERPVFAEYHAAGADTGVFMLRRGRYKYIHYVGMPPQLFDLETDPGELSDLAGDPAHADRLAELERELRAIADPEAVDRLARGDQAALVERHGGRDAVVRRGSFGATPPPGEKPAYQS